MEKFKGDWTAWFSWICNRTISNATDYQNCIESTFYSQEELLDGANMFDYPTAMTVILMIAIVVIGIEQLSGWARTKIIGDQR